MNNLIAADVMTTPVLTVPDDWGMDQLASYFVDKNISGAPVTDATGHLVGVVTMTDIVRHSSMPLSQDEARDTHEYYLASSGRLYTDEEMDAQIADRARYASDMVEPNFVKIFLDGTPEGYQVPFVEPYSDGSGEHGLGKFSPAELQDIVADFDAQGIATFMHAVGDGSARMALDAIEAVRERNGDSGIRHRVAHLVLAAQPASVDDCIVNTRRRGCRIR